MGEAEEEGKGRRGVGPGETRGGESREEIEDQGGGRWERKDGRKGGGVGPCVDRVVERQTRGQRKGQKGVEGEGEKGGRARRGGGQAEGGQRGEGVGASQEQEVSKDGEEGGRKVERCILVLLIVMIGKVLVACSQQIPQLAAVSTRLKRARS